jgi:hypothetical protein
MNIMLFELTVVASGTKHILLLIVVVRVYLN